MIGADQRLVVPFTLEEAAVAADEWGLNCGPAAIAAITGRSLDELRPHLGDFEVKRYVNPTMMWRILRSLGIEWAVVNPRKLRWPQYGLARVQWHGPWMAPGVPMRVRYRHTHWVGTHIEDGYDGHVHIFDVNCMRAGGWVPLAEWQDVYVPQLNASGGWSVTHALEVKRLAS